MRGRPLSVLCSCLYLGNTPAYAGKTTLLHTGSGWHEKHPRVCGEDCHRRQGRGDCPETPPRMRGRRLPGQIRQQARRNTPAYAGKTFPRAPPATRLWKHPRVCGEDISGVRKKRTGSETPPRMRGRPICRQLCRIQGRNTPAYAGKTTSRIIWLINTRKHPRVCGEDHLRTKTCGGIKETPPRMRGRRYSVMIIPRSSGNTPAYAGKTLHT